MQDGMRAIRLEAPGGLPQMVEAPRPTPRPGEVTVDVATIGAGLTLELARSGQLGGTFPRIPGHEIAGTIREVGIDVSDWKVGDRVTTSFYLTCGECVFCRRGRETLCEKFGGFVGAAIDGGMAETVRLPARNLVRVPDGVGLDVAGVVADAVATPVHVVSSRARVSAGDWVAVIGAGGGLGVHAVQVLRAVGGRTIAVESDEDKCHRLASAGFANVVLGPDWERAIAGVTDGAGPSTIVDCVGSSHTLSASLAALAPGGTLVILGAAAGAKLELSGLDAILRETSIVGTRYASRSEIAQALALVEAGRVVPVIGSRFALDDVERVFDEIRTGSTFGRIVIAVGVSE